MVGTAATMLGLYALLAVPLGLLSIIVFRPARSNDEPPGLALLLRALLSVAAFAVAWSRRRRSPELGAGHMVWAACIAALVLTALWEVRLMAGATPFDGARFGLGVATLGALLAPAAWLGSWWRRGPPRG